MSVCGGYNFLSLLHFFCETQTRTAGTCCREAFRAESELNRAPWSSRCRLVVHSPVVLLSCGACRLAAREALGSRSGAPSVGRAVSCGAERGATVDVLQQR